jgi:enamine deaminase RidA (YjgF/YER057c/UK114 family)
VLPDAGEFKQCWPILRKYFGEVRPAAMMISAGLADPRMRIEIEVTARRQAGS